MNSLIAFIKKEIMELIRTGKLILLVIVSMLFGIMNPLIAKITPWLMDMVSTDLAETGISLSTIKVDVFSSWTQFYKNIPMLLIVFVVIMSGILTIEYQKGTLINILTKGLDRWKVIIAKFITMIGLWSICYGMCFLITYLYNIYFWPQHVPYVFIGALCVYLLGIWIISLIILASSLFCDNYAVLGVVGGIVIVSYLGGLIPHVQNYLPTQLMSAMSLLVKEISFHQLSGTIYITVGLSILDIILSILFFNKKAI